MPSEEEEKMQKIKNELIEKGLHMDWLCRAHQTMTMGTLIYLWDQRYKWMNENQKVILSLLQDYEKSGKGLIKDNDPAPIERKRRRLTNYFSEENPEIYEFTCELFQLIQEERPIWDKLKCPKFGYHQPMRQSWCNVSLKLGGWGTMEHVHMLKQIYRRKRDQYNLEHLRKGRPFIYSESLSFLKNVLEMSKSPTKAFEIELSDHLNALVPGIEYDNEISEAPDEVQRVLRIVSSKIDEAMSELSPDQFSEYLSKCCNDLVANREYLASDGIQNQEMNVDFKPESC